MTGPTINWATIVRVAPIGLALLVAAPGSGHACSDDEL